MTDSVYGQDAQGNVYDLSIYKNADAKSALAQEILNLSTLNNAFSNEVSPGIGYNEYFAGGVVASPGNSGNTYIYSGGGVTYPPYVISGGTGGSGGTFAAEWESYPPYPPETVDMEALTEKIVTRYVPGNPLVICVNDDLTPGQMDEISVQLNRHNVEAVIIRGARAGTGRHPGAGADEHKRIDILARLAETWERNPDLTLAELLRWWTGVNMTDDEFAAATDVYARKVYE